VDFLGSELVDGVADAELPLGIAAEGIHLVVLCEDECVVIATVDPRHLGGYSNDTGAIQIVTSTLPGNRFPEFQNPYHMSSSIHLGGALEEWRQSGTGDDITVA
jgi:hypothetical protein